VSIDGLKPPKSKERPTGSLNPQVNLVFTRVRRGIAAVVRLWAVEW